MFDPRIFCRMVVTDTCAIWHSLSSRALFSAALEAKITFCTTQMVIFECLYKPRKLINEQAEVLKKRLEMARGQGHFSVQTCSLDDLVEIVSRAPKGLGAGELSCIAVAYKLRTLAVMTDEKAARHFAEKSLSMMVETTPRLYGYLHFHRYLSDGDHRAVIAEHESFEKRPLTPYFDEAYREALRCRAMTPGV